MVACCYARAWAVLRDGELACVRDGGDSFHALTSSPMKTLCCLTTLGLLILTGCEREPEKKIVPDSPVPVKPSWADDAAKPRITKERAIEIAKAMIADKKINTSRFNEPRIDFADRAKQWQLVYDMKPPTVKEGAFTITVDEDGKATFISGQ
jgi:hypothetical protein